MFAYNDLRAHAVYTAARQLGLQVPRDLSVAGFDNLELIAKLLDPHSPPSNFHTPKWGSGRSAPP